MGDNSKEAEIIPADRPWTLDSGSVLQGMKIPFVESYDQLAGLVFAA